MTWLTFLRSTQGMTYGARTAVEESGPGETLCCR